MKFIQLLKSTRKDKRYMIIFDEPKKIIHFGSLGSSTYLEHKDKKKRENYIKRHAVNEDWGIVNAGSLSRWILWGDHTDLKKNMADYFKRYNISI